MNSLPSLWIKGTLHRLAIRCGAVAVGFARAEEVSVPCQRQFSDWLRAGRHGTMSYLARHEPLRKHPRFVLPGVKTVISMAFPYRPAGGYHHAAIADYALGQDYHRVLRRRIQPIGDALGALGAAWRICVDSAPLPERYWAVKAGVGYCGRNGQLIVPGVGSEVFLAEVLTSFEIEPGLPEVHKCKGCSACLRACPHGALLLDGTLDSRRCLSYLTIEHRGEWPAWIPRPEMAFGCDICQRSCPHNASEPPEPLAEFQPRPELHILNRQLLSTLTRGQWRHLTANSPMSRISKIK